MRAIAAVLVALLSFPAFAQEIPKLGESIEVSIVNVDVFVTDKKGNRVRGLTKDDFEIREDGKPQPITNFAEYTGAPEAGTIRVDAAPQKKTTPAPAAATPRAKRTILVFIERFNIPPLHAKPFFAGIRDFLHRVVRPDDAATIVTWRHEPVVRQEFTDDLEALDAVLADVEAESVGVQGNDLSDQRRLVEFEKAFQESLAEDGRAVVSEDVTKVFDSIANAKHDFFEIKAKTAALESFLQSMSGVEGKKIALLAMRRFGVYAGAEFFQGGLVPPRYQGELDTRKLRERVTRAANANSITLYPIYPTGLAWTPLHDALQVRADVSTVNSDDDLATFAYDNSVLVNETGSLTELADRTGGLTQFGSKNLVELLPRIADDLESYYSLAYRATTAGKDDARRLVVTTKNRDYTVRARRELVEKSDETKMRDRVIANLFLPLEGAVLPIEATLGELTQTAKNRWTAPLSVKVPIRALTVIDGANGVPGGGFSVYVATGGVLGVISDVEQKTQPFTIKGDEIDRARDSHFTYELTLQLDRVTDRVSVAVQDELSKEFGLTYVEVPDRAK